MINSVLSNVAMKGSFIYSRFFDKYIRIMTRNLYIMFSDCWPSSEKIITRGFWQKKGRKYTLRKTNISIICTDSCTLQIFSEYLLCFTSMLAVRVQWRKGTATLSRTGYGSNILGKPPTPAEWCNLKFVPSLQKTCLLSLAVHQPDSI